MATPCQCVCHNRNAHPTSSSIASKPPLVDLPCEGTSAQATTPLSEEGKLFPKPFDQKQNPMINYLNVVCFLRVCLLVSAVQIDQSRNSTLSSRLSEKLQTSLSNGEQDDDFKIDKKRIRTPTTEQKVPLQIDSISVTLLIGLWTLVITFRFVFFPQTSKRRCLERGVIYIDDDEEEEHLERPVPGVQSWTMEFNSGARADSGQSQPQCCVSAPQTHFLLLSLIERLWCNTVSIIAMESTVWNFPLFHHTIPLKG